jgi:hypothetical protein
MYRPPNLQNGLGIVLELVGVSEESQAATRVTHGVVQSCPMRAQRIVDQPTHVVADKRMG